MKLMISFSKSLSDQWNHNSTDSVMIYGKPNYFSSVYYICWRRQGWCLPFGLTLDWLTGALGVVAAAEMYKLRNVSLHLTIEGSDCEWCRAKHLFRTLHSYGRCVPNMGMMMMMMIADIRMVFWSVSWMICLCSYIFSFRKQCCVWMNQCTCGECVYVPGLFFRHTWKGMKLQNERSFRWSWGVERWFQTVCWKCFGAGGE